jgi:hypothetical protein
MMSDAIQIRVRIERLDDRGLPRFERLIVLRAQLSLLRMRAEQGIAISVESLARAESIARTLELAEVSA